jgi:DNA-binding FadR family transcriptional regulator
VTELSYPNDPGLREGGQRTHVMLAEHLRRRVQLRLILPGDSLPPERELMRIFSAGRGTVQQALALLMREGLVTKRRGRSGGAFVTDAIERQEQLVLALERARSGRERIEEALEFRMQIEPGIIAEACRQRTDADLQEVRASQRELTVAETTSRFMHFDNEFHLSIARATHNRYMQKATDDIRIALNDALWVADASQMWLGRTVAEHDNIVAAIEQQNVEAGHRAALAHAQHAARHIRETLALL